MPRLACHGPRPRPRLGRPRPRRLRTARAARNYDILIDVARAAARYASRAASTYSWAWRRAAAAVCEPELGALGRLGQAVPSEKRGDWRPLFAAKPLIINFFDIIFICFFTPRPGEASTARAFRARSANACEQQQPICSRPRAKEEARPLSRSTARSAFLCGPRGDPPLLHARVR